MIRRLFLGFALLAAAGCDRKDATRETPSAAAPAAVAPSAATSPAANQSPTSPASDVKASDVKASDVNASDKSALSALREVRTSVVAFHRVKDFDQFKEQFDRQVELRRAAGALAYLVSRVDGDEGKVIVHFGVESEGAVRSFLNGPEADHLLDSEPALESSRVWIAENAIVELPSEPLKKSHSLYLRMPVKDFSRLEDGLRGAVAELRGQGLALLTLLRAKQDPRVAILHLTAADRQQLERLHESPSLQKALGDAGADPERKPIFATDVR